MRAGLSFLIARVATFVALGALTVTGCGAGHGGAVRASAPTGRPAPAVAADFHAIPLTSIDGRAAPLSTLLGGHPALVSFWAPWCEPCVRELPQLERLARALSPCQVSILGVAVGEKPQTIAAFSRTRRLTYPQFTDEQFTLADALGQRRIPATVVFDGAQHVVYTGELLDRRATTALMRALGSPAGGARCALP
jgi:thiol-disulfide isomerase/thioredoxin